MPNIFEPDFDELRDQDGFRAKRARIGYALGSERLGISLWEVPPGEAAYPYHFHLTEEEVLIVLSGKPLLRTPSGWTQLEEGQVISFRTGPDGAHQLHNSTDQTICFLAVSTNGDPDVVLYPDSGKLSAAERRPDGRGIKLFFREADAVDYWDGETPPGPVGDQ